MYAAGEPYFWMGRSTRWHWNAWLEFPAASSHAALVEVAGRLRRDLGAVVVERYPEDADDDSKEYWRLRAGPDAFLLMRKPPDCPVGLCVESGDVASLVRIGRAWGVERFVGWRWRPWWAWHRLSGGRVAWPLVLSDPSGRDQSGRPPTPNL